MKKNKNISKFSIFFNKKRKNNPSFFVFILNFMKLLTINLFKITNMNDR